MSYRFREGTNTTTTKKQICPPKVCCSSAHLKDSADDVKSEVIASMPNMSCIVNSWTADVPGHCTAHTRALRHRSQEKLQTTTTCQLALLLMFATLAAGSNKQTRRPPPWKSPPLFASHSLTRFATQEPGNCRKLTLSLVLPAALKDRLLVEQAVVNPWLRKRL